jgi:ferric enterobactin receptor
MSADRNTYTTRDMPSTAGGNATDVLRNVPAVEVDQDGKVSLRGNQNVAVQINGRAAPMRGDQLGQFLQQLLANMVERVEVIPNPSARYDPEGMAGIVNIVLKGNAELGLSGGLTASAGTGDRYNGSGNLGYQRGALTLYGNLGLFDDNRELSGFSNRTELGASGPTGTTLQAVSGGQGMNSQTFNGNVEYKLGRAESLAGNFMVSGREFQIDSWTDRVRLDAEGGALPGSLDRQQVTNDDHTFDGTLSFRRLVQPRQNETSLDLHYNRSNFDMGTAFTMQPLDEQGNPLPADPRRTRNLTDGSNSDLYLQADVTRMVAGMRLETGYKGQLRQVDNDLTYQTFTGGDWTDLGGGNRFSVDEQVHAGYVVLTRNRGPVELQGGARLEHTDRETSSDGELGGFTDLFPSGLVAYNVNPATQLKASYSRRIQRPQTQLLNSFYFYETPLSRFHGNPLLRPEYTDAYELGFQRSTGWGSLQLTPFYRHTTGAIRRTPGVLEEDSILTSTVENVATSNSYGADFNATLRRGAVNGFVGFNAFQQESDGNTSSGAVSSSGFGWSARANASLKLTPRTDLQLFGMYRAPMRTEFGRMEAFSMANLSLRQKFLRDKASVTLRVADPLNTMRFSIFTERDYDRELQTPGYTLDSERRFGARAVFLSFNYTFGQTPRLRAPRPQEQAPADPSQTGSPVP